MMLFTNIKIALRNLTRERVFSLLNLMGLSIGIACCLLLLLYIDHEISYDKHHVNADRLFRLKTHIIGSEGDGMPTGSPPIAWALKAEIPEIKNVVRIVNPPQVDRNLLRYNDRMFYETNGFLVDSTFFDVFTYEFIQGDPKSVFSDPNTVVLKESVASKLFGESSPIGELITIINGGEPYEYQVTGVIKDKQKESHIDANFYMNMNSHGWGEWINNVTTWAGQNFIFSYVELAEDANQNVVLKKINDVLQLRGAEHFKAQGINKRLELTPVKDIHLHSTSSYDLSVNGSMQRITVVSLVGIFILIIACVNYINLSTAKAGKRALEIGVRKTLGAYRSSLVIQFYTEVVIFIGISAIVGFIILDLSLPAFNDLVGKQLYLTSLFDTESLLIIIGILIVTALISGSYPSLLISSFQPARVLKQSNPRGPKSWFRTGLVVFQFVISITLIASVIIMLKQLNFMTNYEKGYSASSKLVVPTRTVTAKENYVNLKDHLSQLSGVKNITATDYLPGDRVLNDSRIYTEGQTINDAVVTTNNKVDDHYFDILDLRVIAGRKFSETSNEVETNVIINKKAAEEYGYSPEEAVGKHVYADTFEGTRLTFTIIGVVEDFNQQSLHFEITPLMLYEDDVQSYDYMLIDMEPQAYDQIVKGLNNSWSTMISDTPLEYFELDGYVRKKYEADQKTLFLITSATGLAIVISCLGLFGLSLFTAHQRRKEFSIRKVFGASIKNLITLQYRNFVTIIIISVFIATPIIYFGMEQWLQNYVYRIDIGIDVFLISGAAALTIGIFTVSYQAIRSAMINPAEALKSE